MRRNRHCGKHSPNGTHRYNTPKDPVPSPVVGPVGARRRARVTASGYAQRSAATTRDRAPFAPRAQGGNREPSTAVDRIGTSRPRPEDRRPMRSMSTPGYGRVIHKGGAVSTAFAPSSPHPSGPSCTATTQALRSRLRRNARGQAGNAKVNGIRPSRNNTQLHPQPRSDSAKPRAAQYRAQKGLPPGWVSLDAPRAAHRFIHRWNHRQSACA